MTEPPQEDDKLAATVGTYLALVAGALFGGLILLVAWGVPALIR